MLGVEELKDLTLSGFHCCVIKPFMIFCLFVIQTSPNISVNRPFYVLMSQFNHEKLPNFLPTWYKIIASIQGDNIKMAEDLTFRVQIFTSSLSHISHRHLYVIFSLAFLVYLFLEKLYSLYAMWCTCLLVARIKNRI